MKYAIIATLQVFPFLVVANLASEGWLPNSEKRSMVYFGLQYGSLLSIAAFVVSKWSDVQSFFNKLVQVWKHLVVPPLAKRTVLVIVQLVQPEVSEQLGSGRIGRNDLRLWRKQPAQGGCF